MTICRIATRKSRLALWQAEHIWAQLLKLDANIQVELVPMSTRGDKILNINLNKVGGKGLFVKELESAMLADEADIAVHSMKDVPMAFPEGLALAIVGGREAPEDAFVSNQYQLIDDMPVGSIIGTSSLRRERQLAKVYPHIVFKNCRGNVDTRLAKLDSGEYDAIILAKAGLDRLGLETRIASVLSEDICLPAAGQGVLGIEYRKDKPELIKLIKRLEQAHVSACVQAERAVTTTLGGSCSLPIAAFAQCHNGQLHIRARLACPETALILEEVAHGQPEMAETLGKSVANALIEAGGDKILQKVGV